MAHNWGPHYIVPSTTLRHFSGRVLLRETYDEDLLRRELNALGITGEPVGVNNPWFYRKKGEESWIKIGESSDKKKDFAVSWDTAKLSNGSYQIIGFMNVRVLGAGEEMTIGRQNIVDVVVENE